MGCSQSTSLATKVSYLRHTPFFIGMNEPELEHFASFFRVRRYMSATIVFNEGDSGSEFFIIVQGEVDITALDADKNDQFLSSKKRGDFFGEQAVLTNHHKRTSTVTTTDDSIFMVLSARAYQMYLCEVEPEMAATVTNIMGEKMLTNLKKIDFLSDISEWKLQLLGNLFRYRTVEKNEVVFQEGDLGRQLFIISQGSVAVTAKDDEGKDVHFSNLEAGRYFGEIALMVDMPRTATVTANERCLLLVLGLDDFRNFLHVVPDIKDKFEKVVKDRTAEHFKKFKVPFFAAIPKERFKELADLCEISKFEPQSIIFSEGDVGDVFYLTVFGELVVIKDGTIVSTLGAGRYFGEIALVMDSPRTATIVAKTRCVLLSITKDNFSKFFARSPEAYADFAIKLSRQNVPLKSVIVHSVGHELFKEFLASEYSSENLDFYDMVTQFENIPPDDKIQLTVQSRVIINTFIDPSAEQTINIPAVTREALLADIQQGHLTPHIFDESKHEILKLMSTDSFKRFKQGPLFKRLMREVGSYGDNRESFDDEDDIKVDITDYTHLPGSSQPNSAHNSRNSAHRSPRRFSY